MTGQVLKGRFQTTKGTAKHKVLSRSPDSDKLIQKCHMNYSETPLIRTLMGLENSVLNRGVSLLEGFILTEIKALVTESTVLIRGMSC